MPKQTVIHWIKKAFRKPRLRNLARAMIALCLGWGCLSGMARAQDRYAFLAGINEYPKPINPLHGCVNDVRNLQMELSGRYGFLTGNMTLVTDREATRARMLSEIERYGEKVKRGDVFVFGYSGHGTLFPDDKSEEKDETVVLRPRRMLPGTYDAALVPFDAGEATSGKPWKNLILDDELYVLFQRFTSKGCLVIVISDSCHSGTLAREGKIVKAIPPEQVLRRSLAEIERPVNQRQGANRDLGGLYLTLTSSSDEQVSIEWQDDSERDCGLFIYALLKAMRKGNTYRQIFEATKLQVMTLSEAGQTPQMDTRFFQGGLDAPLFAPPAHSGLRVVVRVQSVEGRPLKDSGFILLRQGVQAGKPQLEKEDALLMGKTDEKGLFNSADKAIYVSPGTYEVKVVCNGYRTVRSMERIEANADGTAVLSFKLVREE